MGQGTKQRSDINGLFVSKQSVYGRGNMRGEDVFVYYRHSVIINEIITAVKFVSMSSTRVPKKAKRTFCFSSSSFIAY